MVNLDRNELRRHPNLCIIEISTVYEITSNTDIQQHLKLQRSRFPTPYKPVFATIPKPLSIMNYLKSFASEITPSMLRSLGCKQDWNSILKHCKVKSQDKSVDLNNEPYFFRRVSRRDSSVLELFSVQVSRIGNSSCIRVSSFGAWILNRDLDSTTSYSTVFLLSKSLVESPDVFERCWGVCSR